MENFLEKLFESVPRARLLKLFLQNSDRFFTLPEITRKSLIKPFSAKKELAKLIKIGLVKRKTAYLQEEQRKKVGKKVKVIIRKKKAAVYYVNKDFGVWQELRDLVTKVSVTSPHKLLRRIKGLGKVKAAIVSGVFISSPNSRTDLLIVGDNIRRSKLENFLSQIESELGKSIQYTLMDTEEFKYRMDMYDRFLRDILEYPHEKLINKLNL